jgi:enamine deaminase RidA (YjgF/YER057c/UK114 family)
MAGMELVRVPMLTQDVPYAYAAVARGGTVYAAGACPLDEHGDVVAPGDVTAQAELVMRNLEQALRTAQCGLDDVLKTTVYVASADRADLVSA